MDALILAGGFGTRLAATVPGVPKPMAPVCGKPFLELLLGALHSKGVQRAVLSLGYKAQMIVQHFGNQFQGMALVHEVEEEPLGTGGAIRRALPLTHGDAALVVNGDTLLDLELDALRAQWAQHRATTLVGCHVGDTSRYGRLAIEGERLVGFTEKGVAGPGWINSGHYVLPRGLLNEPSLPGSFSFEADFLMPRLDALGVRPFLSQGSFIDIGIPEDYERAQTELRRWA